MSAVPEGLPSLGERLSLRERVAVSLRAALVSGRMVPGVTYSVPALAEQFGTAAEFGDPAGGIYLWIKLPEQVDTVKLAQAALKAGVSINPGPEWSSNKAYAKNRMRLCFANPDPETIKEGVAVLAEVCRKEFGVPLRSANIDKG